MGTNSLLKAALVATLFSGQLYAAETILLEDRGGVLISELIGDPNDKPEEPVKPFDPKTLDKGALSEYGYPVVSEKMKVGIISDKEAETVNTAYSMFPVFIVGYDRVSVKWMQDNLDYLAEKKAIGLVVNIENSKQMKRMRELTQGRLALQPTPGDDLADNIKLYHYPAYIDQNGVMR